MIMTTLVRAVLTTALAASTPSVAPQSNGPAARANAPRARDTRAANGRITVGTKDGLPSFDVRQLPINEQHRWTHGGVDPEVSAVALSLLRQFASTGRGPVSGVFEVDANDDPARAEFETMLGLAEALAKQIGSDPVADLAAFVEYSAGMLSLSDPVRWPAGSVATTIIPSSSTDPAGLYTLYATPAQTVQGIGYKLVHKHASGTGRYALLFDVPAPFVAGPNVRIHIKRMESLDGVDAGADQDDLRVRVMINGKYDSAGTSRDLPSDRDLHLEPWIVQRKMSEAVVRVWVSLSDSSPPPKSGYITTWFQSTPCGEHQGWSVGPCPSVETNIDLNPSTGGAASDGPVYPDVTFEIDVASGKISGDVSGQVGTKLILQGNETPQGRVELVVDIEPA